MGKAAEVLATPVVSGNVSLYNETDGQAIDPAPVIGMVGSIDDIATAVGIAMPKGGETIFVIGQDETAADGWLGASVYADLLTLIRKRHRCRSILMENATVISAAADTGSQVTAAHSPDGGLLCAVTEMARQRRRAELPCQMAAIPMAGVLVKIRDVMSSRQPMQVHSPVPRHQRASSSCDRHVTCCTSVEIIERRHYLFNSDQNAHEGWLPGLMTASRKPRLIMPRKRETNS